MMLGLDKTGIRELGHGPSHPEPPQQDVSEKHPPHTSADHRGGRPFPPLKDIGVHQLYDRDVYNLSTMDPRLVFVLLETSTDGLTTREAKARYKKFGYNKINHKEQSPIIQFLGFMWNPLSWVMEAAAIVAIALSNGDDRPPDWPNFVGIVLLLIANSTIGFLEERLADNAVKTLMASLAPDCKVKRDSMWRSMKAINLVPGDIIRIKIGDLVPADVRLIRAHSEVLVDQSALTGELSPTAKNAGDEVFSGSTVKQGEAEAVVTRTGLCTFSGRAVRLVGEANISLGHLQSILAKIGNFCLCNIVVFIVAEVLVMYVGYQYTYRRGIDNILVLLIGGIPIAMPTVLSTTLAFGAKQLAVHNAVVTRITAIEKMAAVTLLCADMRGTVTCDQLTVDKATIKTYAEFDEDGLIQLAAYASRLKNQDAIDTCIVDALPDKSKAHDGIVQLDFKPFDAYMKRTEITYRRLMDGQVFRVTKGTSRAIFDLCTRDMTDVLVEKASKDVEELALRGLRVLAVAVDDVPCGEPDGEGLGYRLIGLLPIYDPPHSDAEQTIQRAVQMGIQMKMITGDQLAIEQETGRRLHMGDNMFESITLKEGPPPGCGYATVNDMVLGADGFANVHPKHKYDIVDILEKLGHVVAVTGDGIHDTPVLSMASVGVAVASATDAARAAADVVLTASGLSVIVEALIRSRQIFQRARNYAIYTCSVTIRIVVGFAVLCFAFKFDFPPFMVLIFAALNDGTMVTISNDHVKPCRHPEQWSSVEIFSSAIVYGLYLAASTVVFVLVACETPFFSQKFGLEQFTDPNNHKLHSIVYLQVSIISQALIFVTRSQGWFFTERPSILLLGAFVVTQLVATFIAVYANWGFTHIQGCGWKWAGVAWVWNLVWIAPLDLVKFAMQRMFRHSKDKAPHNVSQLQSQLNSLSTTSSRYYTSRTRSLQSLEPPQPLHPFKGKRGDEM